MALSDALVSSNPADATSQAALFLGGFLYGSWHRLALSVIILVIAALVIKLLKGLLLQFGRERNLPPGTVRTIVTLMTYGVIILAVVNVLAVFDIQLYPLILSLGVLSVVVVLGSQLLISNMLGGAVVYIERPFVIGDLIKVGDNTGTVQGISIRSTTLKGLNGLDITVPNSTFLTTPIVNYTRTKHYLVQVPFTMPREINLSGLVDAVRSHAAFVPGLATDRGEQLYKMGISQDEIKYELHVWVSDPEMSDDARSRIIDIIGQFYPAKKKEAMP